MTIVTVGDNDVIGVMAVYDISFADLDLAAVRADSVTHRGDRGKVVIFSPYTIIIMIVNVK